MSGFGYYRKQSPASLAEQRMRAAGQRVQRLTKLRIDEVSTVDRGAAPGARVAFTKRLGYDERNGNMSLQETIAKSFGLRASGKLSDFDLGMMHQQRAAELGVSLAKYYSTEEGLLALKVATRSAYFEGQVAIATGNAHSGLNEMLKRRGAQPKDPQNRDDGSSGGMARTDNEGRRDQTGDHMTDDLEEGADEDEEMHSHVNVRDTKPRQASFARKVASLMKSGMNFDQAATAVLKRGY